MTPRRSWRDTHYAAFGRWIDRNREPSEPSVEVDPIGIVIAAIVLATAIVGGMSNYLEYLKGNP